MVSKTSKMFFAAAAMLSAMFIIGCGGKNQLAAEPTPNRPFPQAGNFESGGAVIKPNHRTQEQLNQDVINKFNAYKSEFLRSTPSGNYYIFARGTGYDGARCVTQSEAHGYAMIVFALMAGHDPDAKRIFDGMNQLRKANPSTINPALMSWVVFPEYADNTYPKIAPAGVHNGAPGRRASATDGDLDMAYALLLAHSQWGQQSYLDEARVLIAAIRESNIHPKTLRTNLGDWGPNSDPAGLNTRPSDWMPGHFRAFYRATKDSFWINAADTIYSLLAQVSNPKTGLAPDFATGIPLKPDPRGGGADEVDNFVHFSYNACRVPWRIASDWAHYGVPEAGEQINRISSWLKNKVGENPALIRAGYKLDGSAALETWTDVVFNAPFASAMIANPENQDFLNATYDFVKASDASTDGEWWNAYKSALQLLNMLLITGNWWSPL